MARELGAEPETDGRRESSEVHFLHNFVHVRIDRCVGKHHRKKLLNTLHNTNLSSLLFINLTAAAIREDDLLNFQERNVAERKEKRRKCAVAC